MVPSRRSVASGDEIRGLWRRVDEARVDGDVAAQLDAHRALVDHPCAPHHVIVHEVLDEVHQLLRRLGRHDEAIEAGGRRLTPGTGRARIRRPTSPSGGLTPREAAADPTRRPALVRLVASFPDGDDVPGAITMRPWRLREMLQIGGSGTA